MKKQKLKKTSPMGIFRIGLIQQSRDFCCPISGKIYDFRETEVVEVVVNTPKGAKKQTFLIHQEYVQECEERFQRNVKKAGLTIESFKVLTEADLLEESA